MIPPAVAGIALLLAFGRRGLLGSGAGRAGLGDLRSARRRWCWPRCSSRPRSTCRRRRPPSAAWTRACWWWRAAWAPRPRACSSGWRCRWPGAGLIAGAAMAWARALGEFGATLMFAGNLQGRTQTLPLAIYTALESDLRAAQALSLLLVVVAFALLLVLRGQVAPTAPPAEDGHERAAGGHPQEAGRLRAGPSADAARARRARRWRSWGRTAPARPPPCWPCWASCGRTPDGSRSAPSRCTTVPPGCDLPTEERGIAYVPQDYALFPHLTAAENVAFALACARPAPPAAQRREQARAWLDRLGALACADRRPATLSGGERQRVALARALARSPRALLFDEPFAALDAGVRGDVRRFLRARLAELGLPALLVTHDRADVVRAGRRGDRAGAWSSRAARIARRARSEPRDRIRRALLPGESLAGIIHQAATLAVARPPAPCSRSFPFPFPFPFPDPCPVFRTGAHAMGD